jgi:hypothetical protein
VPPRHPSDTDRERVATVVVDRLLPALAAGDAPEVEAGLAEHCAWLAPDGALVGREAVAGRLARLGPGAGGRIEWDRVQRRGAHVALGWIRRGGDAPTERGFLVLEVRRDGVVFGAEAGPE